MSTWDQMESFQHSIIYPQQLAIIFKPHLFLISIQHFRIILFLSSYIHHPIIMIDHFSFIFIKKHFCIRKYHISICKTSLIWVNRQRCFLLPCLEKKKKAETMGSNFQVVSLFNGQGGHRDTPSLHLSTSTSHCLNS